MRTLVVGAGAIGGYFGGRLLEAGRDVTFLVRPRRAAELARTGLAIRSRLGDADLPEPPLVFADKLAEPFDLVLLACKAYDLDGAMASFAPAVGPDTAILPLLNGIRHLDELQARFGVAHVLGGQCVISTTLDLEGRIVHLGDAHTLTFGELDGFRFGAHRDDRQRAVGRSLRGTSEQCDRAGNVGEVGVHCDERRDHLPNARGDRRHRRRRRGRSRYDAFRRVRRDRGQRGLCDALSIRRANADDADRAELPVDGIDVARH